VACLHHRFIVETAVVLGYRRALFYISVVSWSIDGLVNDTVIAIGCCFVIGSLLVYWILVGGRVNFYLAMIQVTLSWVGMAGLVVADDIRWGEA